MDSTSSLKSLREECRTTGRRKSVAGFEMQTEPGLFTAKLACLPRRVRRRQACFAVQLHRSGSIRKHQSAIRNWLAATGSLSGTPEAI
jgi:hypothetical protein